MKLRTLMAVCALALGAWSMGCGDDDDDGNGDGGSTPVAESGGGSAETPDELVACLQEGELRAVETDVPADSSAIGLTGTVRVEGERGAVVFVNFFGSDEEAESFAEGESAFLEGAGAGGGSEAVGPVTIGRSKSGAEDEARAVRDCLG